MLTVHDDDGGMLTVHGVRHVPPVLLCWWTVALGIQCNTTQLYLQLFQIVFVFSVFVFVWPGNAGCRV